MNKADTTEGDKYYIPDISEFHVGFPYYERHNNPDFQQSSREPKGWLVHPHNERHKAMHAQWEGLERRMAISTREQQLNFLYTLDNKHLAR